MENEEILKNLFRLAWRLGEAETARRIRNRELDTTSPNSEIDYEFSFATKTLLENRVKVLIVNN
jgi:DNA-binding sugar fermentation-stimulating protein